MISQVSVCAGRVPSRVPNECACVGSRQCCAQAGSVVRTAGSAAHVPDSASDVVPQQMRACETRLNPMWTFGSVNGSMRHLGVVLVVSDEQLLNMTSVLTGHGMFGCGKVCR
jgi:hypothetical protein